MRTNLSLSERGLIDLAEKGVDIETDLGPLRVLRDGVHVMTDATRALARGEALAFPDGARLVTRPVAHSKHGAIYLTAGAADAAPDDPAQED